MFIKFLFGTNVFINSLGMVDNPELYTFYHCDRTATVVGYTMESTIDYDDIDRLRRFHSCAHPPMTEDSRVIVYSVLCGSSRMQFNLCEHHLTEIGGE